MNLKILVLLAVLVVAGCLQPVEPVQETVKVNVRINNGEAITEDTVEVLRGHTALEATLQAAEVEYTRHAIYGAFVESINGLENSAEENRWWQYYVDGQLGDVGAEAFTINQTVTIEWRYETSAF